jgi:predicted DNA-binding protein YlxM (UPF0122 family)
VTFLEFAKQYHNFDVFLVLIDDAGYSDDEIMSKFDVSKQRIYDARKRLDPIINALESIQPYKRDMRDQNIQLIIDTFAKEFGTTKSTPYDRYAAKRLHVKYEASKIAEAIKALASLRNEPYTPTVNSVSQFETKLPQIIGFLGQHSNNKMIEL